MGTLSKLELLRNSYNKEKQKLGLIPEKSVEDSDDKFIVVKEEGSEILVRRDRVVLNIEEYEKAKELTVDSPKLTRIKRNEALMDEESEELYFSIKDNMNSLDYTGYYETALQAIEGIFKNFVQDDFYLLSDIQCIKIVSLIIDKLEIINKNNYPDCSLEKSERLVNSKLLTLDEKSTEFDDKFYDIFLSTYVDEEKSVYDNNKLKYFNNGKLDEFKKYQTAKIVKIQTILEWLLV